MPFVGILSGVGLSRAHFESNEAANGDAPWRPGVAFGFRIRTVTCGLGERCFTVHENSSKVIIAGIVFSQVEILGAEKKHLLTPDSSFSHSEASQCSIPTGNQIEHEI